MSKVLIRGVSVGAGLVVLQACVSDETAPSRIVQGAVSDAGMPLEASIVDAAPTQDGGQNMGGACDLVLTLSNRGSTTGNVMVVNNDEAIASLMNSLDDGSYYEASVGIPFDLGPKDSVEVTARYEYGGIMPTPQPGSFVDLGCWVKARGAVWFAGSLGSDQKFSPRVYGGPGAPVKILPPAGRPELATATTLRLKLEPINESTQVTVQWGLVSPSSSLHAPFGSFYVDSNKPSASEVVCGVGAAAKGEGALKASVSKVSVCITRGN